MSATSSRPIVIYRGANRDGETFALEPRSLDGLKHEFGESVPSTSRVFIGHDTRYDYETIHGNVVPQVVILLTGVPEERLSQLGGVVFRDPATDRELRRTP